MFSLLANHLMKSTANPYQELLSLLQKAPPAARDRLAGQILARINEDFEFEDIDGDKKWEELLADPRSERLLEEMAEASERNRKPGDFKSFEAFKREAQ